MLIEKNKDLSECTEEEIQEAADTFITKLENVFDEYRSWFGTNPYFRLMEKDFKDIRDLYSKSKGIQL